jgi:hypothetical protein
VALAPIATSWVPRPDQRPFHFETSGGIVHFTDNEIGNDKDETLAAFLGRMMPVVERSDALVIDLRENPGGNGSYNRVLLHALIRSRKLREPGRLFVLIGRRTFSAATDLCVRLEQNTNAVFVGEPTGGSPNGWGDSRKLTLPSSGLTVRVSTLYWQPSDPRDKRHAIAPDIQAAPARDHDAAMDKVRQIVRGLRNGSKLDGEWNGTVRLDFERVAIRIADGRFEIPEAKFTCRLRECTTLRVAAGILFGTVILDGRDYAFMASPR